MKEVYTTRRTILKTAAAATVISLAGRNNAANTKTNDRKEKYSNRVGNHVLYVQEFQAN